MANYISQVTLPNDTSYDVRELFPHVGNCTVAASAAAKTVTIGNFKLYTGAWVVVKFSNTNTADVASLTLNVDGTGAKPIKYRNANLSSAGLLIANRYTYFIYDGTNYQIVGDFDTNSDTYDRNRYRANIKAGTSALVAGNIIVGKDGVFNHLKSGGAFDISYPILYLNEAVAASATTTNTYDILHITITTTQSITLTAYKPVFIKGTLSGTIFTPVSATPLTQTVPTTDDGYVYIYLGNATGTTTFYMQERHPIYAYKNNAFGEIVHTASNVNGYTVGKSVPSDAVFTDTNVTQSSSTTSDFRPLLLGKNNQTNPENLETTVTDQTYVTKHVFVQPSTGNLTLYNTSGDSPSLIFRRGTFVDNLNDWKIYVSGGELRFAQSTANASSETWTTKMYFHASDGNLYVGSTKVSLNGHTHSQYLPKTTYEWNKEISFGNSGYLKIGSFPMYDTNITIDINATTSKTYHGTVVIATQNVSTTSMGSHKIHVYDDPTGNIATSLRIVWTSGSRNYDIYFVPQSWSKNFIHIRALGNYMDGATDICVSQTGTAPATTSGLEPVNILSVTSTGNGNAVTKVEIDSVGNLAVTKGTTFSTTDENVKATKIAQSTAEAIYYPTLVSGAGTAGVGIFDSARINHTPGTTSVVGNTRLILGNATASGTANNEEGLLKLYSPGTSYHTLKCASTSSVVEHTLPTTGGTILNDVTTSFTQTLSSGTKIGTIKINGTSTDLYCQTNTNTDTKVTQSETTTTNYRPIVFGATNSTDTSTLAATTTDQTYVSTLLYAQPKDGILYANRMYLKAPGAKGQLNLLTSKYNVMLRNDDSNTYFLVTAQNDPTGTWTSARPLTINNSTGVCNINGNAATATNANNANNVNTTVTPGSSSELTNYGITYVADPNTSESNVVRKTNDFRIQLQDGTASTAGWASLILGNATSSGTAGNKEGRIVLYSTSTSYHKIIGDATTSIYDHTLPNISGTISMLDKNGTNYWGLVAGNSKTDWVRTTQSGIIPYQNGGAGSGHSSLGTSTWYFAHAYIDTVHGSLDGNAATATKATQDESGNNIKATYATSFSISDHTITLKNKNGTSLGTVTVPDDDTWIAMVGATSSANGSVGYVNAVPPKDGYNTKYLRADGTWATPPGTYSHPTYTERSKDIYKFHVNTLGHVDDATALDKTDVSTLINKLDTGSSTPVDADYYISQYVGGGTTTTSYHRRPMSALWSYVKSKADSVYLPIGHTYPLSIAADSGTNQLTLSASTKYKLTAGGSTFVFTTPPDTKNTAGSTDTSSKIFLIGATSQAANPQTYSDNEVYTTSGVLTTKKVQVGGGSCTMEYNSTTQTLDFVFA